MSKNTKKKVKNCESCVYYDFDDEMDGYVCTVSLDEDDAVDFLSGQNNDCPYYRFYDEYKSVRRKN